jgi:hypothetical protein
MKRLFTTLEGKVQGAFSSDERVNFHHVNIMLITAVLVDRDRTGSDLDAAPMACLKRLSILFLFSSFACAQYIPVYAKLTDGTGGRNSHFEALKQE